MSSAVKADIAEGSKFSSLMSLIAEKASSGRASICSAVNPLMPSEFMLAITSPLIPEAASGDNAAITSELKWLWKTLFEKLLIWSAVKTAPMSDPSWASKIGSHGPGASPGIWPICSRDRPATASGCNAAICSIALKFGEPSDWVNISDGKLDTWSAVSPPIALPLNATNVSPFSPDIASGCISAVWYPLNPLIALASIAFRLAESRTSITSGLRRLMSSLSKPDKASVGIFSNCSAVKAATASEGSKFKSSAFRPAMASTGMAVTMFASKLLITSSGK